MYKKKRAFVVSTAHYKILEKFVRKLISKQLHSFLFLLIDSSISLILLVSISEYFGSPKNFNVVLLCIASSNFSTNFMVMLFLYLSNRFSDLLLFSITAMIPQAKSFILL